MSWRELMAEMLGDITQDIVENVGKEITNAVRVLRRDFDQAVERISEDLQSTRASPSDAVSSSQATIMEDVGALRGELERVSKHVEDAVEGMKVSNLDIDLAPVLQVVEAHCCTREDLRRELTELGERQEESNRAPQEVDFKPVLEALEKHRSTDMDLTDLVQAIREVAISVHSMRTDEEMDGAAGTEDVIVPDGQKQGVAAQPLRAPAELLNAIQGTSREVQVVQESQKQVLATLQRLGEHVGAIKAK